jgi:hypothetical protein
VKRPLLLAGTTALLWSVGSSAALATHGLVLIVDSIDGQGPGNYSGTLINPPGLDSADWFCFFGAAGTPVQLSMSSGSFDTFLGLYRTPGVPAAGDDRRDFRFVAADDNSGPGENSLITINLPVTANYLVSAESWSTPVEPLGSYTLSIGGDVFPCQSPDVCAAATPGSGDIVGTAGPDKLVGTPGNDRIFGLGGNDQIDGGGGHDLIVGGEGDDKVVGGDGNDTLCGGNGNDVLSGGNGSDTLSGGPGDDDLSGDAGDDSLSGAAGADRLHGGAGTNTNDGGPDSDTCVNPPAAAAAC